MFKDHIYDDSVDIVFETDIPVLFSLLEDSVFEKRWKKWKLRYFAVRQDATLVYRKRKDSFIKGRFDLSGTKILQRVIENSTNPLLQCEYGLSVSCKKDGIHTFFRCVLTEGDRNNFLEAIRRYVPDHSIEESATTIGEFSAVQATQSSFRQAMVKAMDKFETRSNKEQILQRRGAFGFLPVLFTNDLVHGSWWFVLGSVMIVITSAVILENSFHATIGEDDSVLTRFRFRATWVLMIISGLFFTLGSAAFVRAMSTDPPMKPLFNWYHLSSDELLGSWLFFFACVPFIFYSLIYVAQEHNKGVYVGAFFVSVILVIGSFIFVVACYPSQTTHRKFILPVALMLLKCCCSEEWITRHLANDWLAGTWIFFWGTLLATFVCIVTFFQAAAGNKTLQMFVYGTTFIENVLFLVGCAYFVAGSYPPQQDSQMAGSFNEALNPAGQADNYEGDSDDDDDGEKRAGAGSVAAGRNVKGFAGSGGDREDQYHLVSEMTL